MSPQKIENLISVLVKREITPIMEPNKKNNEKSMGG
jgi:hypothetical protein